MSPETVVDQNWVRACRVDDVPERGGRCVVFDGREVALFRTSHGAVFAVENRCPHRGGKLAEGIVTGSQVICPLHNWKISLLTGEAVAPDRGCVQRYRADIRNGDVFVDLAPPSTPPAPLADRVGVHPDSGRPKLGRRRAVPSDFTIHDFDREIPVLAVEPPSPETAESFTLTLTAGDDLLGRYSLDELKQRCPTVNLPAYVTCLMFDFSRPVTWQGIRLADLLRSIDLDPFPFASFYSWETTETGERERFFETLKRNYVLDPRTLLVFGMNGAPLPKEHGGPLRLAIPFLQGYKSVKWLTWIKLCASDEIGYKKLHGFIEFPEFNPPEEA